MKYIMETYQKLTYSFCSLNVHFCCPMFELYETEHYVLKLHFIKGLVYVPKIHIIGEAYDNIFRKTRFCWVYLRLLTFDFLG